jgi:hypothetical protein
MNGGAGRVLANALVDAVAEADPAGTARVMDQIAGLSGPGWLRLDQLARRPYWGQSPFDGVADWLALLATPKLSSRQRREIAFVAGIRQASPP